MKKLFYEVSELNSNASLINFEDNLKKLDIQMIFILSRNLSYYDNSSL